MHKFCEEKKTRCNKFYEKKSGCSKFHEENQHSKSSMKKKSDIRGIKNKKLTHIKFTE